MTDINLKTLTLDNDLPPTGVLFGADSQGSGSPSVYTTQAVATTLLGSASLTGDTVATSSPVLNLAQTWNSSGTTFKGVVFNAAGTSDANSAAASLLMDLQVNTTSQFTVKKNGSVSMGARLDAGSGELLVEANRVAARYGDFEIGVSGIGVDSAGLFYFTNTVNNAAFSSSDLFLSRKNTRILQLGQADAATALAQTLSVQSVVAGTTNGAGAAFTINGSQGTGTGAGGSIVFQVAPAGTVGTGAPAIAQNALAAALTINSSKQLIAFDGTEALPGYSFSGNPNVGIYNAGGQLAFTTAGALKMYISNSALLVLTGITGIDITSSNDSFIRFGVTSDLVLFRRGTANLQLGRADASTAVPQLLSVQSVVGGTTGNIAGQPFTITGSQGVGAGAGGSIIFQVAPAGTLGATTQNALQTALTINSDRSVTVAANATAPSGSAAVPSYSISAAGLYSRASVRLNFAFSGTDAGVEIGPTVLALQNTASLVWTSGTLPSSGQDTYLTRVAAGIVKFAGTSGTGPGVVVTNSTVVGSLPAAATAGAGAFAFVTDADRTMAASIGTAVVGGGANKVPVYSDGASWLVG